MKTIKIEVTARTNRVGSDVSDIIEFEVDDNATDKEIETAKDNEAREWMFEQIDWWWKAVTDQTKKP